MCVNVLNAELDPYSAALIQYRMVVYVVLLVILSNNSLFQSIWLVFLSHSCSHSAWKEFVVTVRY